MNITLGGIELNQDLQWQERYAQQPISMSVKRTLGGAAVVYSGMLLAGDPIILVATQDYGWLFLPQVKALQALAAVQGATYELVYNGVTYNVMFDFSSGPAVDMTPLLYRVADQDDDYFTGQIHLITV